MKGQFISLSATRTLPIDDGYSYKLAICGYRMGLMFSEVNKNNDSVCIIGDLVEIEVHTSYF